MIRALRTIPMFVDIAAAIKEYAPDAWVINYTNPMTLCVKTLYHVFPQIKAFGCCHEVFGTQKVLKGICEETFGLSDIDRRDIHINVLGINHFTWLDKASYKGIDLFPYTVITLINTTRKATMSRTRTGPTAPLTAPIG